MRFWSRVTKSMTPRDTMHGTAKKRVRATQARRRICDKQIDTVAETPEETATAIAACLLYLRNEALIKGLREIAHFIGVAAEVAVEAARNSKQGARHG